MQTESKAITENSQHYLVFLILAALCIALIAMAWQFILLSGLAIALWFVWRHFQAKSRQKQLYLKDLFYQLIQENQGYITQLDWAVKANLSGEDALHYLTERAKEFSAELEVSDRGDILYYFSTTQTSGVLERQLTEDYPANSLLEQAEKSSLSSVQLASKPAQPLIQSDLAKRLNVHPSTVSKKKFNPDFWAWSRSQDPEGIAWEYSSETKLFSPTNRF